MGVTSHVSCGAVTVPGGIRREAQPAERRAWKVADGAPASPNSNKVREAELTRASNQTRCLGPCASSARPGNTVSVACGRCPVSNAVTRPLSF